MRIFNIIILVVVLLSGCKKNNIEINGTFFNNNLKKATTPAFLHFDKDSLFIIYPYRSKIIKNKFIATNNVLHISNIKKFDVGYNMSNDSITIKDNAKILSSKTQLKFTKLNVLKIKDNLITNYWYSEDFLFNSNQSYWLSFTGNKLLLKYRIDGEINSYIIDYQYKKMGNLSIIVLNFVESDFILFFDRVDNNRIQFLVFDFFENKKYFIHLNKISKNTFDRNDENKGILELNIEEGFEEEEEIRINVE